MEKSFHFQKDLDQTSWQKLKTAWLDTLTSPQDGMWESFRDSSEHWGILIEGELVGYADIHEEHELIQFYIKPDYRAYAL